MAQLEIQHRAERAADHKRMEDYRNDFFRALSAKRKLSELADLVAAQDARLGRHRDDIQANKYAIRQHLHSHQQTETSEEEDEDDEAEDDKNGKGVAHKSGKEAEAKKKACQEASGSEDSDSDSEDSASASSAPVTHKQKRHKADPGTTEKR